MKQNRIPPKQTKNARTLRSNMTEGEKKLWYHLRNKQFYGFRFRRQHLIGPYIVDFACLKEKLIIELDGGQHAEDSKDVYRMSYLESQGFTVQRFWNNDVMENPEGVLEAIADSLNTPTLVLPLSGGGSKRSEQEGV